MDFYQTILKTRILISGKYIKMYIWKHQEVTKANRNWRASSSWSKGTPLGEIYVYMAFPLRAPNFICMRQLELRKKAWSLRIWSSGLQKQVSIKRVIWKEEVFPEGEPKHLWHSFFKSYTHPEGTLKVQGKNNSWTLKS